VFIGNITGTQMASVVWTSATRTLTADLMQELTDEGANDLTPVTVLNSASFGPWIQVVSSTAHLVRAVEMSVSYNGSTSIQVRIGTGAAASEVEKVRWRISVTAAGQQYIGQRFLDPTLIPKGVRVAVSVANVPTNVAANACITNVTLVEDNS
jgi:hypothetical protein